METLPLLSIIVLSPLVAAMLMLFVPGESKGTTRILAVAASTISLVGSLMVAWGYDTEAGGYQFREGFDLVPSLGIRYDLGVDGWGVSLLLLTSLIIFAGSFATWTLRNRDKEFYVLLLALVAGVYGVFVSLDLFVFFLFYEIAVLPMYLLIGVWGSTKKVAEAGPFRYLFRVLDIGGKEYAAMKLTLMLLLGSAFILAGILIVDAVVGIPRALDRIRHARRCLPLPHLVSGRTRLRTDGRLDAPRGCPHEAGRFRHHEDWDGDAP